MRKYLVLAWLLLPLPVLVFHFGRRGQEWLARDIAHDLIHEAKQAEARGDWKAADGKYSEADKVVGASDPSLKLRLDLARVQTRYRMGDAVPAIDAVDHLLEDAALATMPQDFQREVRELSGRIHYYAAWVMRLEGADRELWMEEADRSRQSYRLLAEGSPADTPSTKVRSEREDLEAAVQLQRLSLTELMARPLPQEGRSMSGQGLTEQMGKRRGQRGNKPGPGKGEGPPGPGGGIQRFKPGEGS